MTLANLSIRSLKPSELDGILSDPAILSIEPLNATSPTTLQMDLDRHDLSSQIIDHSGLADV